MSMGADHVDRVLIIDPSRTMRRLIRAEFDAARFEVFEASTAAEAMSIVIEVSPAIVTLGTVLSDASGAEIYAKIGEMIREQNVEFIVITSGDTDEERAHAFKSGAVHFVKKGFKPGELAAYVEEILRPHRALDGYRILIVDDSPLPRACLKRTLGARGALVVEADDGTTALACLEKQSFDLVITDHFMSVMNGLALVHEIRKQHELDLLPIILLSAVRGHSVISAALAAGANDFVRKPFEATELLSRVTTSLRASSACRQLRDAKIAADEASRQKSAFLANISHEIRTPMTAILGFAENLRDCNLEPAERDSALDAVVRNGEHLLSLISDVLDFSKIEAGKISMESVMCSLKGVIDDAIDAVRHRAVKKGLGLNVDIEPGLPAVITSDPTRLRQILINLLNNAVKFTEAGEIRLSARMNDGGRGDDVIEFKISDTGIGMSSDTVGRLFTPFTQADHSTTRRFGGTGLGLAISRHLAQRLGGDIRVESEPGKGSVFTLNIVSKATDLAAPGETSANHRRRSSIGTSTGSPTRRRRILVAEDGLDNQRLIVGVLERAGHAVHLVSDGDAAVKAVMAAVEKQAAFDLVVMDLQMPVLDGADATRTLREKGIDLPIIALTASAGIEDRKRCLDAGADRVLVKPFRRTNLLAAIDETFVAGRPVSV